MRSNQVHFLLLCCVPWTHSWILHHRAPTQYTTTTSTRFSQENIGDDDDDEIFFDDFAGQIIGARDVTNNNMILSSTALQQRIQTMQQEQIQKDARTLRNWKTGNWNVRGFSMEPYDDEENSTTIVSILTPATDPDSPCIWVGRTDGSVLKVQLGKEYWAYFRSEQKVGNTASLVRDEEQSQTTAPDDEPFMILQQFSTGHGRVTHMLEYKEKYLFTVSEQDSLNIQQWLLHEDLERPPVLCKTFQGAHSAGIVVMKVLPKTNILFSAAQDGSISLWDVETGDILYSCVTEEASTVRCADSDGHSIYLGTTGGTVVAYHVMDLLEIASSGRDICPMPHGQWTACDNGALTSISCGGPGTLGRGRNQPTYLLLTGDENGVIKQWEILPRKLDGATRLEQWPKLATQRHAKKAHVFRGHHGVVSALRAVDATKFVSSGVDGTIRAWNPVSGKELFLMEGFDDPVKSLCFLEDLLITDGMKKFVCVHDFGINLEDESDDADFYLDNL